MATREQPADWPGNFQTYLKMCTLVGCPVQIVFKDAQGSETSLKASGILHEVQETGFVVDLSTPIALGAPGIAADVRVASKQALVQFTTVVHDAESPARLLCHIPEQIEYIQRRSHVRASVQLDSTCLVGGYDVPTPTKIINISVGGAAYTIDSPQEIGTVVTLSLRALGLMPQEVSARVVRCTPNESGMWVSGVKFEQLQPAQESRIGQFVTRVLSESGQ